MRFWFLLWLVRFISGIKLETLENLIFIEQEKEKSAYDEFERIIQLQKDYTLSINNLSLNEGKKSNLENWKFSQNPNWRLYLERGANNYK